MICKESICSTLASEVRAIITTQRSKEMKQLPTDTPSHVKALNKLEREKPWTQGTVTQPNPVVRLSLDTGQMYFVFAREKEKMKLQQSLTHCYLVNPKHLSTTISGESTWSQVG